MTSATIQQTGGAPYLRLLELIPEVRYLIWEQYFCNLDLKIKSCSKLPGLYIVEPEILRLSKTLRKELLKPYVWRLRRDLLNAQRRLGAFGRGEDDDELKDLPSPPWHATELKLQAEILEVEIRRVRSEESRSRLLDGEEEKTGSG